MNARSVAVALMFAMSAALVSPPGAYAEQPPAPCHANPNAAADSAAVASRGDVINLPQPLKDRLIRLADRPHSYLPIQAFAEADVHPGNPLFTIPLERSARVLHRVPPAAAALARPDQFRCKARQGWRASKCNIAGLPGWSCALRAP